MERMRTTLLLLLVVGLASMTGLPPSAREAAGLHAGDHRGRAVLGFKCPADAHAGGGLGAAPGVGQVSRGEETIIRPSSLPRSMKGSSCSSSIRSGHPFARYAFGRKPATRRIRRRRLQGRLKDMKFTAVSYGATLHHPETGGSAASGEATSCPTTKDKVSSLPS
jgi:hypothetical protein